MAVPAGSAAKLALLAALTHGIAPIRPPTVPQHPTIPDIVVALLGAGRHPVPVHPPSAPPLVPIRPGVVPQGLPQGIPLGLLQWLASPGFYESAMAQSRNAQGPTAY